MVGYPEALTDPSYKSQILTLTYPLIGNYGVPDDSISDKEIFKWFESHQIWAAGLVIGELCQFPSHWNMQKTLSKWLFDQGIPGIEGIDTKQLTKIIREEGTMLAKIVLEHDQEDQIEFVDPAKFNLVQKVSTQKCKTINLGGNPKILAVDFGLKLNQVRCLTARGAQVHIVPWNHDLAKELKNHDALFLSNGPGDPQMCKEAVENIKAVLDLKKPIFGICLGN